MYNNKKSWGGGNFFVTLQDETGTGEHLATTLGHVWYSTPNHPGKFGTLPSAPPNPPICVFFLGLSWAIRSAYVKSSHVLGEQSARKVEARTGRWPALCPGSCLFVSDGESIS